VRRFYLLVASHPQSSIRDHVRWLFPPGAGDINNTRANVQSAAATDSTTHNKTSKTAKYRAHI
jgi:hypothetical protein